MSNERKIVIGSTQYASMREAAAAHGISPQLFGRRMAKGLTAAQVLDVDPHPDWFIAGKGQRQKVLGQQRIKREAETGLRRCSSCKEKKLLAEFHNYQQKNLEGPGRCKECTAKDWIRFRYKIEPEVFFGLAKQQNGRCAICLIDLEVSSESARMRRLSAIDHCHETGAVRGLLCRSCNTGIGFLGDSAKQLRAAAHYLDSFQSKRQPELLAERSKTVELETMQASRQQT